MSKLVYLELLKIKRSYINLFLILSIFIPILFIVIQYVISKEDTTFFSVISKNTSTISVTIFSMIIILATYLIAREYKENTLTYLFVTPVSRTKLLLSKLLLLLLMIVLLELITFGLLALIHLFLGDFTLALASRLFDVWWISSLMFFLLTPVVTYIVLLRKDFVPSLLISLAGFIFTFPFVYRDFYYFFPHLIPMVTVTNYLENDVSVTSNGMPLLIMLAVFVVFLFLSITKINRKG
ncbi:ABC transporter permease [Paenibacillus sp. S150]|uniref:ABC transporter permease n=1 Tax=Paenibacillus sp. S150 TaxID=2749826 RepID=UPI001C577AB4|nr:ABC transporter permease [Paenibacillus sp. S150]MBW4084444.1 ABC transporter permease [Paenibacillus sp. S150]